jgi:hypothetical protein
MFNSYGTMYVAFNSGKLWLNLLFVGGTCCLVDFLLISLRYIFFPSLKTQLQILVNQKQDMKISNINSMPKSIKDVLGIYGEFNATQDVDFIETKKFQDNKVDVKINNKESEKINIDQEKDNNDNTELMKIKNNKSRADKNDKKIEEAPASNDNELNNLYHETKTKNANKADVVIVKGQNSHEEIIEEDSNSKEAFLK